MLLNYSLSLLLVDVLIITTFTDDDCIGRRIVVMIISTWGSSSRCTADQRCILVIHNFSHYYLLRVWLWLVVLMVLLLLIVIYIYNNSTFVLDIYDAGSLLRLMLMMRSRLDDLLRLLGNNGTRWVMNNETSPAVARCDGHGLLCLLY